MAAARGLAAAWGPAATGRTTPAGGPSVASALTTTGTTASRLSVGLGYDEARSEQEQG